MFRMLGNNVELIHYKVKWQEQAVDRQENCISEEHKNEVEQRLLDQEITFTTEEIGQTENEWINGLEFQSYDEALEIFAKGEAAYNQEKTFKEMTNNLRLRADIDYLAILTEVEL